MLLLQSAPGAMITSQLTGEQSAEVLVQRLRSMTELSWFGSEGVQEGEGARVQGAVRVAGEVPVV